MVMAPGGVVGRVSKVSPNASVVILLSDAYNQVGVTVSRTRATGFIKGQTGENASSQVIMAFFDKNVDVRKGDTVVTSAFSKKFPAGLPVGRVESVDMNKSPAPEAIIQLTAPIASLEWAAVYPNIPTLAGEDLKPDAPTAVLRPDGTPALAPSASPSPAPSTPAN